MTAPYHTWTSQADFSNGSSPATPARNGGYHPHCGKEHAHKPVKAMVGVGLFVVLSFLLYELKSPDATPTAKPAQHANVSR
ncbi:MAG: hypothetical protein ABWY18_18360 [Tardiphaga sp.]